MCLLQESLIRRKQQDADIKISMLNDMNERYNKKIDELNYKNTSLEREKQDALEQVRVRCPLAETMVVIFNGDVGICFMLHVNVLCATMKHEMSPFQSKLLHEYFTNFIPHVLPTSLCNIFSQKRYHAED